MIKRGINPFLLDIVRAC